MNGFPKSKIVNTGGISGKGSSLEECSGTGTGCTGQWLWHKAAGVQKAFGQCSQAYDFGLVLCEAWSWTS